MLISRHRIRAEAKTILLKQLLTVGLLTAVALSAVGQTTSPIDGVTPAGIAPGTPAGSHALSGFEHYNSFSGTLNPSIPLYHVGGRGEAGFDLVWNLQQTWLAAKRYGGPSPFIAIDPYPSNNVAGPRGVLGPLGAGAVFSRTGSSNFVSCGNGTAIGSTLGRIIFVTPNGTQVELVDQNTNGRIYNNPNACTSPSGSVDAGRGNLFRSTDGSSMQFTADSPVLDTTSPAFGEADVKVNGVLRFSNGTSYRIDGSTVTWIQDRNGNQTSFLYGGQIEFITWNFWVAAPTQITDSTGRITTINYNDSSCGGCTTITYPGFAGSARVIQIVQAHLSASGMLRGGSITTMDQLFPGTGQPTSNFDPILPSYIQYPDGSRHMFQYNSYGELARVTLPTGGAIEYDYGNGHNGSGSGFEGITTDNNPVMIYRRLQERREYANGSALSSRTHYTVGAAGSDTQDTAVTYDANSTVQAQTITSLFGSPLDTLNLNGTSCNSAKEGLAYQTDTGAPSALVTVQYAYDAGATGCMNNPHLVSQTTILDDTNQVSQVTFAYDGYNNLIDRAERDWGNGSPGPLVRDTKITYQTAAPYLNANLVSLPIESKTLDAGSTLVADTQMGYDEGSMANAGGIIGHDNTNFAGQGTRGNLTSVRKCLLQGGSCSFLTTTMTYDIAGNLVSLADPNNHATSYIYTDSYSDGANRNSYAHVTSSTDPLGHVNNWTYDFSSGQPVRSTNMNQGVTQYSYDPVLDRLSQTTLPNGATSQSTYPSPNEVDSSQDQASAGDRVLRSRTLYDGMGRPSETDRYESGSQYIATTQTYDALGRTATVSNPARPGETVFTTSYRYDSLSRPQNVTTPDGAVARTSYSGNTTTATDQAGHSKRYSYDALGRLVNVLEDPGGLNQTTDYGYDLLDDLTAVSQGYCNNCLTRTFVYDSLGRLISAQNPESGTVRYGYDAGGNLQTRTDARGIVTTYGYDAGNRVNSVVYSAGSPNVAYTYYQNEEIPNGNGQLKSMTTSGVSTTTYGAYNSVGQALSSSQTIAGQTYSFAYLYNLAGALVSETYPSGRVVQTGYDAAGRPSQLTGARGGVSTNYVSNLGYASHGAPASYLMGNMVGRRNTYNGRLQPAQSSDAINNSDSSLLMRLTWNWGGSTNSNGNLYGMTAEHGGAGYSQLLTFQQNFGYDVLNRVVSASDSGGWSRNFGYDQWGNMWVSGSTGQAPAGNTPTTNAFTRNQLPSVGYDQAGNQSVVNGNSVTYDAENHQVSVAAPAAMGGGIEYYFYDGAGQRVQKSGPGGVVNYIYDAFGVLSAEYDSVVAQPAPCQTCYLSTDHLGNLRLVTDQAGFVVSRHDYLPYGEETAVGRNAQWSANDTLAQKFTGQMRDPESGEDYFNARMFGSAIGRFTSPDPGNAGADPMNPQSWNGYSYALGNPMVYTDPSGMFSWGGFFGSLGDLFGSLGSDISNFFNPPCGADFCATGTSVGNVNNVGIGISGGLVSSGENGGASGRSSGNAGGSGQSNFSVTHTEKVSSSAAPPKSGTCANGYSGTGLTYGPSVRKHIELLHMNFLPNGASTRSRPYMRNGVLTARSQYAFSPSGTPDQNWNLLMQINAMTVDSATPSALPDGNVSFTATLPPQNQPVFGARPFIGLEGLPLVNLPLLGWTPRYNPTNVNTVVTSGNCSSVQTSHPGPF